jgi:thiamine biosynthesis lipoprotein
MNITAAPPTPDVRRHPCTVFGCEVVLATCGRPATPFERVEDGLRQLERRFSRFVDGNELAALNASAGSWVAVSAEMERLLGHALQVAVDSHGLVNIAVTAALRRAGYVSSWPARWRPSGPTGGAAAVPALTEVLELRSGRARLARSTSVDFGGIAKGLWADDVVAQLGTDAAASLGGDVAARGPGPTGEGWPVGLANGRTLVLRDGGVATSGTSKRAHGSAHHLIDPRTGLPARSGLQEVTVVAGCATTAEWLATAVLVAGPAVPAARRQDVIACFTTPEGTAVGPNG